jgi:hypothetical protein
MGLIPFFEKMMDWAKGREGKKKVIFLYCSMPTITTMCTYIMLGIESPLVNISTTMFFVRCN